MNGIDEDGNTALHFAAENGAEDIVRLLVDKGADLNAVNDEGDTPLHKATVSNYAEVIALLIEGHADVNAQVCANHEISCFKLYKSIQIPH